jgi:Holliday junction resolvase RusA-like endonuclease
MNPLSHAQREPMTANPASIAPARESRHEQERVIAFTIFGEPASKANSRKIANIGGVSRLIKGKKALSYERDALMQIPIFARQQLKCLVSVTMRIFYATERPDLDESLLLDILQDRFRTVKVGDAKVRELVQPGVYCNDRQVREKHIYHAIDKRDPRTLIEVRPLASVPFAPGLF